jgi:HrpA-like RNA helicase
MEIVVKTDERQVLLVHGETGSGKTTQIPQFLLPALPSHASIVCTQPTKLAAYGSAARVSKEMGTDLGALVGYKCMHDQKFDTARTRITFMTDGFLLKVARSDPLFMDYSVIILVSLSFS